MSNYKAIHESELIEFMFDTIMGSVESLSPDMTNVNSINRSAKDFVLTFPVYVSKSMNHKSMELIASALEKKYSNILLILLNTMNDLSEQTIKQYIKRYHINLGSEWRSLIESSQVEVMSEILKAKFKEENPRFIAEMNANKKGVMEDMKNISYVLPESLSTYDISGKPYSEASDKKQPRKKRNNRNSNNKNSNTNSSTSNTNNKADKNKTNKNASLVDNDDDEDYREFISKGGRIKSTLTNGDVKKANDISPTLINVTYYPSKGSEKSRSFMLGVKSVIYPIDGNTLVSKLALADSNRGILNLVRASTREISFAKDLIFSIDTLKNDAKKAARNRSSMKEWKALENRARLVKANRLSKSNIAQAISTIVITKYEADELMSEYNIDVSDIKVVTNIMRKYALLGFIVIDEEYETVDMHYDGDKGIETVSFRALKSSNRKESDAMVTLLGKLI